MLGKTGEVSINLKYPQDAYHGSSRAVVGLGELVVGLLRSHWEGIAFREWNAGDRIDAHMKSEGFNVSVSVDKSTGLVSGGNLLNCGTWMDKMGSSDYAGTRGFPATPRDGAAIEINATCLYVLTKASGLFQKEKFIKEWLRALSTNFDNQFWNPSGFYRDTVGSAKPGADDKLRPNAAVALAIVPKQFVKSDRAQQHLEVTRAKLLGPVGMKTLPEEDGDYRGYYDNGNQSADPALAHGYNYHNGPEWVWPLGFYISASLKFETETHVSVSRLLAHHTRLMRRSPWKGLPELTNKDGAECGPSCPTQAWSMGTLIEVTMAKRV